MTPETVNRLLARFSEWLTSQPQPAPSAPDDLDDPPLDLSSVLREFVALRHEVNLHTKATRTLNEQVGQWLAQLQQDAASSQPTSTTSPPTDRPASAANESTDAPPDYLRVLIEMYDPLLLAHRELQRMQTELTVAASALDAPTHSYPLPNDSTAQPTVQPPPKLTWWMRQSGAGAIIADQHREIVRLRQQLALHRQQPNPLTRLLRMFQASIGGFELALERIGRQLASQQLQPIPTQGVPFDPERMEAVEVVAADPDRPFEPIEELRRGWLWQGRVLRYAQVRLRQ